MFKDTSFLTTFFYDYVLHNLDARCVMREIESCHFDIRALVDHCTIRTLDIMRVEEWLCAEGFKKMSDGTVDMGDWFLQSFYKIGYPTIVVDQPHDENMSENCGGKIIFDWVKTFGDNQFHHIAVRVSDIEQAVKKWAQWGVSFAGGVICDKKTGLKQIFTKPVERDGHSYTVLEFIERPPGCTGLVVPNADKLVLSVYS